jgi:hypothetical protein
LASIGREAQEELSPPAIQAFANAHLLSLSLNVESNWLDRELFYQVQVVELTANGGGDRRMTWQRRLPKILYLNDGRSIATLAHARDLLLGLPQPRQADEHWAAAGELILQGAYRGRRDQIADVHAQISRALRVDGLL